MPWIDVLIKRLYPFLFKTTGNPAYFKMARFVKKGILASIFIFTASILSVAFSNWKRADGTVLLKDYAEMGSVVQVLMTEEERQPTCIWDEDILEGRLKMDLTYADVDKIAGENAYLKNVKNGGQWRPSDCKSKSKVAVIIPFRNRKKHLGVLLKYLHPLLQKQKLDYRIFVIEQLDDKPFNKGKMMNVGFKYSQVYDDFDCFVFHDVDMIPEDERNDYGCPSTIRHMAPAVDKFNYKLRYWFIFGGVTAFKKDAFMKVNGFANKYYGWGAEDDDMYYRVQRNAFRFIRAPMEIGRYTMIKHAHSEKNLKAKQLLDNRSTFIESDGISTLNYTIIKTSNMTLYTLVAVDSQMTDEERKLTTAVGEKPHEKSSA